MPSALFGFHPIGHFSFLECPKFPWSHSLPRCYFPCLKFFLHLNPEVCSVFGPTCDALDVISMTEELPDDLQLGDLLYSPNIGAYSHASSTYFNGFPPAKIVHLYQASVEEER